VTPIKCHHILSAITALCFYSASEKALPESGRAKLLDYSLEQLVNLKITTGQLMPVQSYQSPAAVTVITQEHISRASAKNLSEVLEIYVPGLMLMAHSEGNKIGLRGHIAAENYKLLLLINGRNLTNMVYEGPMTELDHWNLKDIERIEVVRGPGSVVYGTGAIAGVINIITKTSTSREMLTLSYHPDYRSKGISYQYSHSFGEFDTFWFGSYQSSEGLESPKYYQTSPTEPSSSRYIGFRDIDTYGPQAYLGDSFDRPQIKLHVDLRHGDNFTLFARYTQSGQAQHFRTLSPQIDAEENVIGTVPNRKVSLRNMIISSDSTFEAGENSQWKLGLSYDSQEYLRYDHANPLWPEDHPNNIKDYAFSQNRWVGSALYEHFGKKWSFITGYQYEHINVGAPWGKSSDHIMIREGVYLINDFDSSVYTQDLRLRNRPQPGRIEEIGNGLDFISHTHLFEGNFHANKQYTLHYGHRLDLPDTSAAMYSPRLSLISRIDDKNSTTFTVQRALRMMPLRAQYLYDKHEGESDSEHEKIDSLEFAYTHTNKTTEHKIRAFYNEIEAIGFTGQDLQLIADFSLLGLELESRYKNEKIEFIANHSYLRQVEFSMNEDIKDGRTRNNISYADYYFITRTAVPITLNDSGNSLNNWSENSSKFILNYNLIGNAIKLQLNAQIYWDYKGAWEEIHMYQSAYDNFDTSTLSESELTEFENQLSHFQRERALLEDNNAYQRQINFGASISYEGTLNANRSIKTTLHLQNLLDDRKRYYVNTGSSNYYPNRLNFINEPRVIWLTMELLH
jgi:hypothetical protein